MAHKYPLAKPMLLLKSKIDVNDKQINIQMHIKGAEFLKLKKTDKRLQKIIKNLLGKQYNINIEEKINEDDLQKYEMHIKEIEEQELQKTVNQYEEESASNLAQEIENVPEFYDPDYKMPELEEPEAQEINQEYIMGKPSKAKEKKMKIKDLTANDGRVTLEGRILTCEARETKSGKGMITYELYDGTGTIACKSFTKDIEEGTEITKKIKQAKAIKLIGKANLDTYIGDIAIIANTIIGTDTEVPKLPTEIEDSPLIYGNTLNINERIVKIADLGVDDGKVSIKGEIIGIEEKKDLKGGKTLLSIDVYDGTSTMTCKAFVQKEQSEKVVNKLQKAKGIQLAGMAQMDSFSNEITIMAKQ